MNVDDSSGASRLVIKKDDGKLKVNWQDRENVHQKNIKKSDRTSQELTFHGESAEYVVDFKFVPLAAKDYKHRKSDTRRRAKLLHGH